MEPLVALYDTRVATRWTEPTRRHYRWVLRNMLDLASNLTGRSVGLLELLKDEPLLGQTFATATTADGKREISAWLAAQRRSVLRSFTQLMDPELRREGIGDAGDALARALRSVAEPVGTGYRLPGGKPRGRGGPTPSIEELAAIQDELARKSGWRGARNEIILGLMTLRGVRVGGLLGLDGVRACKLPDGCIRCFLRAKSKHEPYELAVPDDLIGPLVRYVEQFNAWAQASGLPALIGFGTPGRFWRNDLGWPLTYLTWTTELKQACVSAGLPVYTSHAFRRAFATTSTMAAPRATVAIAGNWTSTRRMDDHYVHPSSEAVRGETTLSSPTSAPSGDRFASSLPGRPTAMTQRALDLFDDDAVPGDTEALIGRFKEACRKGSKAPSTIAAEASQLRSLARDAETHLRIGLADLLDQPEEAAELIEFAGLACGRSTVLTRSRALQRFAMLQLSEGEGRSWVTTFRNALPKTKSGGWHDSGLSLPGTRGRAHPRSPTPDPDALEAVLRLAVSRSLVDGAIAGLACFSGLELDEICQLRWSDLTWRDDRDATFCEVGVHRRGRRTTCLIVSMGARPLFSLALASGLQRNDYVFPGRKQGENLSKTAMRDRLRHLREGAGWPGLSRSQLTAAFVLWLREHDLDDHSIMLNLGRRRAATIDRLTRSHESIAAQLSVVVASRGLEL